MTREKYKAAQKAWVEMTGIKVGDYVQVCRMPEDDEYGWGAGISPRMESYVSEEDTYKVTEIHEHHGLYINSEYYFPFFVLEPAKVDLPDPIELESGQYEASFNPDGSIEVGCQKISFKTLEMIYETAKGLVSN
jgi:hypothetical protein